MKNVLVSRGDGTDVNQLTYVVPSAANISFQAVTAARMASAAFLSLACTVSLVDEQSIVISYLKSTHFNRFRLFQHIKASTRHLSSSSYFSNLG